MHRRLHFPIVYMVSV